MSESDGSLVLINLFTMPPELVDTFVDAWPAAAAHAPGFRGTRLHRAIVPDAPYPVVNIARWDSVADWQATVDTHFATAREGFGVRDGRPGPVSSQPALYRVVHITPRPAGAHRRSRRRRPGLMTSPDKATESGGAAFPAHDSGPLRPAPVEIVAELDRHPTGIVTDGERIFVLAGTIGVPNWQLVCLHPEGRQDTVDLPELVFGNGMARSGHTLLAADSALGLVVGIDPATGRHEVWAWHALLTGPDPDILMPGANGIAGHSNGVYVSNTGRGLLLRFALEDPAASPEKVARRLVADNFTCHPGGRIFLATHFHHSVVQLDPDGNRITIASPDQGIAGSTSVALDPRDPDTLYVTTTGGMHGIEDRTFLDRRANRHPSDVPSVGS